MTLDWEVGAGAGGEDTLCNALGMVPFIDTTCIRSEGEIERLWICFG